VSHRAVERGFRQYTRTQGSYRLVGSVPAEEGETGTVVEVDGGFGREGPCHLGHLHQRRHKQREIGLILVPSAPDVAHDGTRPLLAVLAEWGD